MDEKQEEIFGRMLKAPFGIILVTGPTGSGKSTTLYAALSQLAEKKINCVTVEDPVEKLINGVTQVQVNAKAGLTFATALRSILRQDPDVIMVGEIRDEEIFVPPKLPDTLYESGAIVDFLRPTNWQIKATATMMSVMSI